MTVTDLAAHQGRPSGSGIRAAAIRFDEADADAELMRQIRRHEQWQRHAWGYYDEVGEVGFAVDMRAEQLARCPLTVVARPDPASTPVPVDDPDSGVPADVAAYAMGVLRELKAPVGGQKQIIRQAQCNTAVAGEWYLLNYQGPKENLHGWHVRSSDDIKVTENTIESRGLGDFSPADVSRVWQPHPRRFELANSGLRRVLSRCETVLLIDRQFRGALRSRLFAGLLLLSNGFRQSTGTRPESAELAGDGEAMLDPVIEDIFEALSTAIQDEGTASSVVPNTLYGSRDDVKDGARLLHFQQQIDPIIEALRTSELRRIAQGLDEPASIVLGETDLNHWNMWWVGEQAIEMAIPKAEFLADSFTQVYLHPMLGTNSDIDPAHIALMEVALDLTPLRKRPDAAGDITFAHGVGEASGKALRRILQIPESDAPDSEDTDRWLLLNKTHADAGITADLIKHITGTTVEPLLRGGHQGLPDTQPGVGDAPAPGAPNPPSGIPAAVSAGGLHTIETVLTERLFAASLAAFRRALEKAGNRARTRVSAAYRASLADVAPEQVVAHLGAAIRAASTGLADHDLLTGALSGLKPDYKRWVTAAQAAALATAVQMSPTAPDDAELADIQDRQAQDGVDAWAWFEAASLGLLASRMADGKPVADWEVRDLVRRSLARAGGANELAPYTPGEGPADGYGAGLAYGPEILGFLAGQGVGVQSWTWVHGEPSNPYPEHTDLNGEVGDTEDDFGGYFPGDHDGCTCDVVPSFDTGDETP